MAEGAGHCPRCGNPMPIPAEPVQPQFGQAQNTQAQTAPQQPTPMAPMGSVNPMAGANPMGGANRANPYMQNAGQQAYNQYGNTQSGGQVPPNRNIPPTGQIPPIDRAPMQPMSQQKKSSGSTIALAIGIPLAAFAIVAAVVIGFVSSLSRVSDHNAPTGPDVTTVTPPVDVTPDPPVADGTKRTVMLYIVGSDLESGDGFPAGYDGAASADIEEILAANIPEGTNVVLECGGSKKWIHPDIADGEVTRFTVKDGKLVMLEALGKTSMTTAGALKDFIQFASTYAPAENYTLVLWDHGGGIPVGFGMDELGDMEDRMCDYEIKDELDGAGIKFDSVIFDACNMCTLEMGMALKDHADYMVGAESEVSGIGIYYTRWIENIDKDARSFCEVMVQDYMDALHEEGVMGSMSVIRLDYIDEVYGAYIDYLGSINISRDYADYVMARGNCGYYVDNDSVDLTTLATSFDKGSYSTALMNWVSNAVVYTESDYPYGHGLMVYSPYSSYYEYDLGRVSFEKLGYDDTILDFYDGFIASLEGNYDNAGEYTLQVVETEPYCYVDMDDEDWDVISEIVQVLMIEGDNEFLFLGRDYDAQIDSNGRLSMVDPSMWTYVNGDLVGYYCYDQYSNSETGEWSQMGGIPITVNGMDAYLYMYYDNENPDGVIQGYRLADFDTEEESDMMYTFNDDDEIEVVMVYMNMDLELEYVPSGDTILAKDLIITYEEADFDEYSTLGYYELTDVYGNTYTTDLCYYACNSDLQ